MENQDENAGDQFVSADVFLSRLGQQPAPAPPARDAAYKRASLAQLQRQGGIRNKISQWEKKGPLQPAAGAAPPQRKPSSAAPRLPPVSEEAPAASRGGGGLFSRAAAAVQAVLPSPGTKQAMAARQEAVRFPSIMFGTKPPAKQPAHGPLPKPRAEPAAPTSSAEQWRLAAAPQGPAAAAPASPEADVAGVDAGSESSSEWHDASDIQVVLKDGDNESVSSEATTVVPGEEADEDSTAESGARPSLLRELPSLQRCDSPTLPEGGAAPAPARRRSMRAAASEVFHSAVDMLSLDGSLALAASGSFSFGRALLSRPSSPEGSAADEGASVEAADAALQPAPPGEGKAVAAAAAGGPQQHGCEADVEMGDAEGLPCGSPAAAADELPASRAAAASAAAEEEQLGIKPVVALGVEAAVAPAGSSQAAGVEGQPSVSPAASNTDAPASPAGALLFTGTDSTAQPEPAPTSPAAVAPGEQLLALASPGGSEQAAAGTPQPGSPGKRVCTGAAAGEAEGEELAAVEVVALEAAAFQVAAVEVAGAALPAASESSPPTSPAPAQQEGGPALAAAAGEAPAALPLRREFSEADLLYRGVLGSPEPDASHQLQSEEAPPASLGAAASVEAAATGAGEPEAAVGPQREAGIAEAETAVTSGSASPAPLSEQPDHSASVAHEPVGVERPAAAGRPASPGAAAAAAAGAAAQPPSPRGSAAVPDAAQPPSPCEPPTPYAVTEYDGDDVVMGDAEFTPCPTAARTGSRTRLEALVLAGLAVARTPLPLSPAKTPASAASERPLVAQGVQTEDGEAEPVVLFAAGSDSGAEQQEQQEDAAGTEDSPAAELEGSAAAAADSSEEPSAGLPQEGVAVEEGAAGAPAVEAPAEADAAAFSPGRRRLFAEDEEAVVGASPADVPMVAAVVSEAAGETAGADSTDSADEGSAAAVPGPAVALQLAAQEAEVEAELGGAEEQATLEGGTPGEADPAVAEQGAGSPQQALGSPQQAAVAEEDAGQVDAERLAADASLAASEPLAVDSATAPAANKQPAPAQPAEESEVVGSASPPGANPPEAAGEATEVAQAVEEPMHLSSSPPLPASPSMASPAPSSPGAAVPAPSSQAASGEMPADESQSLAGSKPAAAASAALPAEQGGLSSAAEAGGSEAPPAGLDGEEQQAASAPVAEEQVPSPASPAAASGAEAAAAGAAGAVQEAEAAAAAAVVVQEAEVAAGEDIEMMDVDAEPAQEEGVEEAASPTGGAASPANPAFATLASPTAKVPTSPTAAAPAALAAEMPASPAAAAPVSPAAVAAKAASPAAPASASPEAQVARAASPVAVAPASPAGEFPASSAAAAPSQEEVPSPPQSRRSADAALACAPTSPAVAAGALAAQVQSSPAGVVSSGALPGSPTQAPVAEEQPSSPTAASPPGGAAAARGPSSPRASPAAASECPALEEPSSPAALKSVLASPSARAPQQGSSPGGERVPGSPASSPSILMQTAPQWESPLRPTSPLEGLCSPREPPTAAPSAAQSPAGRPPAAGSSGEMGAAGEQEQQAATADVAAGEEVAGAAAEQLGSPSGVENFAAGEATVEEATGEAAEQPGSPGGVESPAGVTESPPRPAVELTATAEDGSLQACEGAGEQPAPASPASPAACGGSPAMQLTAGPASPSPVAAAEKEGAVQEAAVHGEQTDADGLSSENTSAAVADANSPAAAVADGGSPAEAAAAAVEPPGQFEGPAGESEAAHGEQQEQPPRDSPTMSINPLAASLTPHRGAAASPAFSTATGAISNSNPLFAGTPGHPTPPSVTLKTFALRYSEDGTLGTPLSKDGSATPASVGIKLAERLQEVASQLQHPAAGEPLAHFAATPGQPAAMQTPGAGRFDFAADVAAMLQALNQQTPATAIMPGGARAAAMATTVQRQPRPTRFSFAAGAAVLDLERFDADGNRSGGAVPPTAEKALPPTAEEGEEEQLPQQQGSPSAAAGELAALRQEVDSLRSQVAELECQREEAVGMLAGYQGSIAQLQDQHSAIMVKVQTENTLLRAEVEQLRGARTEVERQFHRLYHDKYLPLKGEAGPLRQEAAELRAALAAEEGKARKAQAAVQDLQRELSEALGQLKAVKEEKAAALAAAAAAQQAEQRLEQRLKAEAQRSSQSLQELEAQLGATTGKYGTLAKSYDEAVHKANLARQARERAHADVERKEEEICALEVKLKELEGVLRDYKRENSRFFDMKERFKARIAGLEQDLQAKEQEKETLVGMCNELVNRLEREGLSLA